MLPQGIEDLPFQAKGTVTEEEELVGEDERLLIDNPTFG
jgi:hypothetical protein